LQVTDISGGVTTGYQSSPALVFDIGGTTTRAGIVNSADGSLVVVDRAETPNYQTHPELSADALLEKVLDDASRLAAKLLGGEVPSTIIAGYPGPVSLSGVALRSPTILGPALDREFDVKGRLSARWGDSDVTVLNDLSCAGYRFVAQGHQDFCVITVGSGIGSKVFLNGRPVTGAGGRGGEIGHLQSYPGPGSAFEKLRDELGNISSGRGTIELCRRFVKELDEATLGSSLIRGINDENSPDVGKVLAKAFRERDEQSVRVVEMACYPLAAAIGAIHLAIGLESFFIVGGFAKALGDGYLKILIRVAEQLTWNLGQEWEKMISIGEINAEEGLLGAAYLASHHTTVRSNASPAEV